MQLGVSQHGDYRVSVVPMTLRAKASGGPPIHEEECASRHASAPSATISDPVSTGPTAA